MSDYEKLKKIIQEIDTLVQKRASASTPEFKAWKMKTRKFLAKRYGEDSMESNDFMNTHFTILNIMGTVTEAEQIECCVKSLIAEKAVLNTYLEEIEEEMDESKLEKTLDDSRIFVVHGHDELLRERVARAIEKSGKEAIILNEQVNKGMTIIEKLEKYSDVGRAVCLFTADDVGKASDSPEEMARARQNVVFETGYFIGLLGRENVVIIAEPGIELPSDLNGVVYTDKSGWQGDMLRELE